jgi:hypothetical protein
MKRHYDEIEAMDCAQPDEPIDMVDAVTNRVDYGADVADGADQPDKPKADQSEQQITVRVPNTNPDYHKINHHICKQYIASQSHANHIGLSLTGSCDRVGDRIGDQIDNMIAYELPHNITISIKHMGEPVRCTVTRESPPIGLLSEIRCLDLMKITTKKHTFESLVRCANALPCRSMLYRWDPKSGRWNSYGVIKPRSEESIVMDKQVKAKILEDVRRFIGSEPEYTKYSIPYKRNYLFHGKPGTGKTSLVRLIGTMTRRSIYTVAFDSQLSDTSLFNAIREIRGNALLLLEDIDCSFKQRDAIGMSVVTMSGLLNALDGIAGKDNLITFITTNHLDKLDPALIRPGRVDMMVGFADMSDEQIHGMFELFGKKLDAKWFDKIRRICGAKHLTPCVLSGFMFKHLHSVATDAEYVGLFEKYLETMQVGEKQDGGGMYA